VLQSLLGPEVSISSTQVSRAAETLDAGLQAWRERPLNETPLYYPFATNSMVLYHIPSSTCSTLEGHFKSERLDAASALWP